MRYPEKSYYDTLGVPIDATDEQIKAAYREQIKFFHPDVFQGSPEIARQKSQELNEAYGVLIDHEKRADYDAWLRARDYERAQARKKAEEDARQAEERRREAEEQERKQREEAERAKKEEEEKARKQQADHEERDRAAEKRDQAIKDAVDAQKKRESAMVNIALAVCLLISIAAGIFAYSKTQSELVSSQEQLDKTQATLVQLAEDSVRIQSLCNYYKRAEECVSYVVDTFRDMYSVTPIYTTFADADTFRNSVRERIESDLSLVESCYKQCAELEATTDDDLALLRDVQKLCEKAFDYLNRLESGGRQAESGVASDASGSTMQAISVMYTARSCYWELEDTE